MAKGFMYLVAVMDWLGAGSRLACLTMVFKLAMAAQKQWRALNGSQLIAEVIDGGALRRRRETESRLTPYTQHLPISPRVAPISTRMHCRLLSVASSRTLKYTPSAQTSA